MKQKKNCFRDVARSFQGQSGNSIQPVAPTDPSGGEVAQLNAKISELEARLGEVAQLNARIAELEAENATLREQQGAPADPSGGEVGQLNAKIAELEAGSQAIVVDIANLTWDESMGMRHPARPCMDKRITAADKKCKKYQKWGWQETFGGRVPSCVRRSNTCGPDRRSAADIASDPYDKKHGPYVPDVPEPTLSAEEKLHQEEEKLHQENVRRFEYKSSAARRNACLSATGGVCLPGGGYAQQLVNKGKLHPCHQCGIQSALGREGRVGGIAAFDRIIACQQKTQTPCD
jgi:outer membrane murein-binding lipoprotein Lpp